MHRMVLTGLAAAIGCVGASGLPGLVLGRRTPHAQRVAVVMVAAGSASGLAAAGAVLATGVPASFSFPWVLVGTRAGVRIDALSAFFLIPIFLVGAAGSVYGLGYWRQAEHPRTAGKLQLCYGGLIASMAMVVVAADGVVFLMAWEIMALLSFFLVSTEDDKRGVREAGWLYLVCAHAGTLILFALFALLHTASGTFEFRAVAPGAAGPGLRTAMFLAALGGFGLKAGIMPLHFWLPGAHANAPSHVSAVLSGVLLKVGVYGLLRTTTLLPGAPASWGGLLLFLGTASAVLGVLFAVGQHDLKRLLAYHSIENIGIILMGLGLALLGRAHHRADWVALGLAGCLLHVWNHSLFKSLLFLAAGSVVRATHTREIDRMGGLGKLMPRTAALFFVGAVAICGLPPLNGFVSELFVYLGLLRTLDGAAGTAGAALAAACLAAVGALAVACFVKAYGAVFLGVARAHRAERARESSTAMTAPMAGLALCCAAIGIVPLVAVPALQRVIDQWDPSAVPRPGDLRSLAPLAALTALNLPLAGLILAAFLAFRGRPAERRLLRTAGTWDCGYARPAARMQYTASSFAGTIVRLFGGVLRPHVRRPTITSAFPTATRFESHVGDVVLDGVLTPAWRRFKAGLVSLRVLQQGSVQRYVFYILIILLFLLLLLFVAPFHDLLRPLWSGDA